MSRARGLSLLLALLVLLDLLYSASQHYRQPLDGDVTAIVLPAAHYAPVLHDPFGVKVLRRQQGHAGTNRFFAHATELAYLRAVPGWLQGVVSPISSVYLACALLKTTVQALLLTLLAAYACRATGSGLTAKLGAASRGAGDGQGRFWLAAALLAPLFQTAGYQGQMGIIDRSITYTFFYALPLALLLVLLWPFFAAWAAGRPLRLSWARQGLLLALGVYLAFHGPIINGVAAVLLGGALLAWYRQHRAAKFGRGSGPERPVVGAGLSAWGLLLLLAGLSLYSLNLGRYNTENLGPQLVPLAARYPLLARGIGAELTSKLGLPLLVLAVLGNTWLLARRLPPTPTSTWLLKLLRSLGWFALGYLLLLPLGGYRSYRPLILRYDTLLPLTLGLALVYAATVLYLLRTLAGSARRWYQVGLLGISAVFMFADKPLKPAASNAFERQAMTWLAATSGPVVQLPAGGTLLSWQPIGAPAQSGPNARLLHHWRITPQLRLYYQQ